MAVERMNHWLQISANAGIIVSLLLVGFQLKQNTDLLGTELLYEESKRFTEFEIEFIGENGADVWAKSLTNPRELTLAEHRIMEAILWTFIEQLRSTTVLADKGLISENDWRLRVANDTSFYFGNAYGRAWWETFIEDGNNGLPAELITQINFSIVETNDENSVNYKQRLIDRLPE